MGKVYYAFPTGIAIEEELFLAVAATTSTSVESTAAKSSASISSQNVVHLQNE